MDYSTNTLFNGDFWLVALAIIMGGLMIIALFVNSYLPFKRERDYIKKELDRSYEEEYGYWKRQLRRLYLRSIPLLGRFFR